MKPKLLQDGTLRLHVQAIDCHEPSLNLAGSIFVGVVFAQGDHVMSTSPPLEISLGKCLCCDIGGLLREATSQVIQHHLNPDHQRN